MRLNVYLPVRIKVGEVFKDVFPCAAISSGEQSGYILHDEKSGAKQGLLEGLLGKDYCVSPFFRAEMN